MNKFIQAKEARLCVLFCFLFFILGCINSPVYEKNMPIDHYAWGHQQVLEFKVNVDNNNQRYDLFLNLRHTSKYKYSNLSVIIEEISPKNQEQKYPIELQLTTPDGRWIGTGTSNIQSYQVQFLKGHHFTDTGEYTFRVKQNMRVNPLPEIVDVGIKVMNGKVIASN